METDVVPPDIPPPINDSVNNVSLSPPLFLSAEANSQSPQNTQDTVSRKRAADISINPTPKKTVTDVSLSQPSIQTVFTAESSSLNKYSEKDKGPFIVHVVRIEEESSSGLTMRPIKFGQFLHRNNVQNIAQDGVKSVGRNRVAIQFKSASDANSFLSHPALATANYKATVPTYNVTRMGIIRDIPVEWSMEEVVEAIQLPPNCGPIIKARRISRKTKKDDDTVSYTPTQSVVITISGQVLPERIYCFYNSILVEQYQFPTIQCWNCCRFGHVKIQCRSKPRCFKCSQPHDGNTCEKTQDSCLYCSGPHRAIDKCCPEFHRQKAIKIIMSQESVSYKEASIRLPPPRKSFADAARSFQTVPPTPTSSQLMAPSQYPKTVSHRKTVVTTRQPRSDHRQGYDRNAHLEITNSPPSSLPNGHAFPSLPPNSAQPNENLLELLLSTIINLLTKFSDCPLPPNVTQGLNQILQLVNSSHSQQNGQHSTVELQEPES